MRVVSCRFSLVLKLLRPLALGIIAVLTFRYHSHAASGAAVTLQDYCVFHWLERRARLRRALVGIRI